MSVHMWIHSCVYTRVRMCQWLCVGLQCPRYVSNGDAAVLRRAIDMWLYSRMHANTCMSMAWCGTAVSPVRQQWNKSSTCAFKHQNICCTLRNNDRRFDIIFVAGGTRGCRNDNLRCRWWRQKCSVDNIQLFVLRSSNSCYSNEYKGYSNGFHVWNWSHVNIDGLVKGCGI